LLKAKSDYIPFYSYFYYKDLFGFLVIFSILIFFVSYYPNALGHSDNYIQANALVTPKHIVPEWYFLPFYGLLRAIPNKFGGIAAMFSAIIVLGLLPYIVLSQNIIRNPQASTGLFSDSSLYYYRMLIAFFAVDFVLLAWIGGSTVTPTISIVGLYATGVYFFIFFAFYFLYGQNYFDFSSRKQ
jgi:ubiquinol-cytochrome c reductase cytochrome b subunit